MIYYFKSFSRLLMMAGLILMPLLSFAQTKVTGKVTSAKDGVGVPGVNVLIKGTYLGGITDVNGDYSLNVSGSDATLVFSCVGFISGEEVVGNRTVIDIVLSPDIMALDEIVVIGYGTSKKSDLTGAVSSVDPIEINKQVLTNAAEGLKGQTAGVFVTNRSSQPGGGLNIRIRGTSSIAAGNDPLYVVDGVPLAGGIGVINPADIESLEVLKDASAQAIYGSRASGGVIMITTKRGKSGKMNVDFESYWGFSELNWDMDLMDLQQSVDLLNTAAVHDGLDPFWTESEIQQLEEYDWIDLTTRKGAIQSYNLNFNGGNEATRYNVSANYFNQEGVMINSDYSRATFKVSLDSDISDKFNISTNINLSNVDRNDIAEGGESSGLFFSMIAWPFTPPYDDEGNYTDFSTALPNYTTAASNPLPRILERLEDNVSTRIIGNIALNYRFIPSVSYKFVLGTDVWFNENSYYSTSKNLGTPSGYTSLSRGNGQFYTNQNILTWDQDFGEHSLTATGVFEWTKYMSESINNSATGFFTDELGYNYINIAEFQNPARQSNSEYQIASFMGRVNYRYKERYMFTTSVRADGSSKFGEGNKWGIFPSAAMAWRISKEDFMKDVSFLSNLKLRAGWGQVGNQSFNPYESILRLVT